MNENPKKTNEKIPSGLPRVTKILPFIVLFLVAVGVQVLVWQNNQAQVESALSGITVGYKHDAAILYRGDFSTFLFGTDPPNDAAVLGHPPGYPILIAAFYGVFGESADFRLLQILLNALGPLIVWLIVQELFGFGPAWIAAFLTAASPQISYNGLFILPDSLGVLPLLMAIYFVILAYKKERIVYAVWCGLFLGLSCWFRANGLLLPVFVAAVFLLLLPKYIRIRSVLILLSVFVAVVLPITIRNYVGFHAFIPISLGSGVTLVEGIGDFDKEGKFGLPATDAEVLELESRILDCPACLNNLYAPNGVERERWRTRQAMSVIGSNPFWFAGVAIRRGVSFFRFERVPAIAAAGPNTDLVKGPAYYLNVPLRLFQKSFVTAVFLPLFIVGVLLLLRNRKDRDKLLILLTIPLYYVCFQSLLHTEYRYILAIQHFILIISAYALVTLITSIRTVLNARRLAGSE